MSNCLLSLKDITKIYPNGVVANKGITMDIHEGEIHAIVGENGAGKSTLVKMIFGMEQPSLGEIRLRDEPIKIDNPQKAIDLGIGMVHQHFMLVPSFTVMQNLLLGEEPKKGVFIDNNKAMEVTKQLSEKYNLYVEPTVKIRDLTVGMKQKVEILKALYRGAKILILDEPTAVLTSQETVELFSKLQLLKEEGHTIIFISHKLKEVKEISDKVSVIRQGKFEGTYNTFDITEREISKLMVGRDIILKYDKNPLKYGENILTVKDIEYENDNKKILDKISFSVKKGEILGIAGVEGNGQNELVKLITRLMDTQKGEIRLNDTLINNMSISELRANGLSYIPEDRMTTGIAGDGSIADNILANRILEDEFTNKGLLAGNKMKTKTGELIEKYVVKCSNALQKIIDLSGGNIQKVVVARECSVDLQLLIAEQPTRGVDVGSIEFIHNQLLEMRDEGLAILLISADLNEILELCDNIIVMYEGEIVAYFDDKAKVSEEELGMYMLGLEKHSPENIRRAFNE